MENLLQVHLSGFIIQSQVSSVPSKLILEQLSMYLIFHKFASETACLTPA